MTREDAGKAIAIIRTLWPHSSLGPDPEATLAAWATLLGDATAEEVGAVLRALASDGREHAPPVGVVAQRVALARQGAAPPFEEVADVTRWIPTRVFLRELYDSSGHYSPESTVRAIELMADGGAPEAACRFVQERGLRSVLSIPDGERYALDMNQLADRRDAARHYRDVTVPGWKADPRPGLALSRAQRAIGRAGGLRPVGELTEGS